MKMIKIGIVSTKSICDVTNRSGSGYFLAHLIAKKYEVVDCAIKDDLFSNFLKLLSKIFKRKRLLVYYIYIQLKTKMKLRILKSKNDINLFLVIAGSSFFGKNVFPKDCKIIYLTDATNNLMQDYYFHNDKKDYDLCEKLEYNALNNSTFCIFSSNRCLENVINHYNISKKKCSVIPFPSYVKDCNPLLEPKNYKKKEFNALLVGVDYKRKGIDTAIDTINLLNNNKYNLKFNLNIVGVNQLSKSLSDNVKFFGRLNKNNEDQLNKLVELYTSADFFLLPTKAECSAIVFSEACMFSLPIFTSNTGGIGDYVIDDYNGWKTEVNYTQNVVLSEKIINSILSNEIARYSRNSRILYEQQLNEKFWLEKFSKIIDYLYK